MFHRTTALSVSLVTAATAAIVALAGCSGQPQTATTSTVISGNQGQVVQTGTYVKGIRTGFTDGTAVTTFDQDGFSITFPEAWANEVQDDPAGIEVIPTDGGWMNVYLKQAIDTEKPQRTVVAETLRELMGDDVFTATTPERIASSNGADMWRTGVTLHRGDTTYRGFVEFVIKDGNMTVVEGFVPGSVWDTDAVELRAVFDSITLA